MRGKFGKRVVVAVSTALVVVSGATGPADGSTDRDSLTRTLPSLAEQQRYRAELGLPSGTEYVTDLNAQWADGDLPGATVEGAVFAPGEEAELDAREAAATEIAKVARSYFVGPLADAYGGVYIDHATGRTVVQVTRDPDYYLGVLRSRVGVDPRVVVRHVPFALTDLERVAATIGAAADSLADTGADIVGVAVDEVENIVHVSLVDDTTAARSAVVATLDVPNDAALVNFDGALPDQEVGAGGLDAPPVKGGQQLVTYTTAGDISGCTSGFVAYTRTRTDIGVYLTEYYLVTAGHCQQSEQGYFLQTELYIVGQTDLNAYPNGSDSLRIPLMRQADHSNRVLIVTGHDRLIYARQASSADVAGERVCMSGVSTGGELCGTLLTRSYLSRSPGFSFPNQRIVSFDALPGDSGGSVLLNSQAKGIVRCRAFYRNRWRMCYGHIQTVLGKLGLTDVDGV